MADRFRLIAAVGRYLANRYYRPRADIALKGEEMPKAAIFTLTDLPSPDDKQAIFAFAMSFNGYEEYGSFEGAAAAAREQKRSSLTEVRNELFFISFIFL